MGIRIDDIINCGLCSYYSEDGCKNSSVDIQKQFNRQGVSYALQCRDFTNSKIPLKSVLENKRALGFILGGHSEFMVESGKTGTQFIFKLERKNNEDRSIYWMYVREPSGYYKYSGTVYLDNKTDTFEFAQGKRGALNKHDVKVRSLLYIINNLRGCKYSINVKIYHFNKCGSCGNKLSSDVEMERGICDRCNSFVGWC